MFLKNSKLKPRHVFWMGNLYDGMRVAMLNFAFYALIWTLYNKNITKVFLYVAYYQFVSLIFELSSSFIADLLKKRRFIFLLGYFLGVFFPPLITLGLWTGSPEFFFG